MSGKRKRCEYDADNLAFIARVTKLSPVIGHPNLELATVKGWNCIVEKGQFKVGDLGVYYAVGCIPDKTGRVKTVAMGGVISQGVLGPMSWLSDRGYKDLSKYKENDSVAVEMKVKKFIEQEEADQYEKKSTHEPFPESVPKTESTRLQHDPIAMLAAIQDKNITITRKEDGCSCTFMYLDGEIKVCSRNYAWTAQDKEAMPVYYATFEKYGIGPKLRKLKRNIAIQGEIVGPAINGNRLLRAKVELEVFDIFDIDAQQYLSYDEMCALCSALSLRTVPLLYRGPANTLDLTVEGFMKLAEATEYASGECAEGIVVNSDDPVWRTRRVHFKVISNKYLLKHNR